MRFRLGAAIGRALECARTVLRDLDDDQVPAKLRKVVAHAGDLTPPLADLLAREMDRLDWLREGAAERWPDADPKADGPDRASALFLLRPEGWGLELARLVGEQAAAAATETTLPDPKRERDYAAAREKAKSSAKEIDALKRQVADLEQRLREPGRARAAAEARESGALEALREEHDGRIADLQERIARAEQAVRQAKESARQAKAERADLQRRLDATRYDGSWVDRDPIDLAMHLDAVAAQARPRREGSSAGGELPPPELPGGVRPDSAEAIDVVLRLPGRVALLVDGYNAGIALVGAATPSEVRIRLEDVLRRVRTLGGPGFTVTVVWDSATGDTGGHTAEGLDVRFTSPGVPADDVLVELAAATSRAVVVTNDREVRERAGAVGALPLWSTALVEWWRGRR